MARWSTVLSGVFLALSTILSLGKLLMLAAGTGSSGELTEADQWLTEIDLPQYRSLFKKKGECRVGHRSAGASPSSDRFRFSKLHSQSRVLLAKAASSNHPIARLCHVRHDCARNALAMDRKALLRARLFFSLPIVPVIAR